MKKTMIAGNHLQSGEKFKVPYSAFPEHQQKKTGFCVNPATAYSNQFLISLTVSVC